MSVGLVPFGHIPLKESEIIDIKTYPDFSYSVTETTIKAELYGELKARVYASNDKSLHYLFYEAVDGRAFLASVEKVRENPITMFGVRKYSYFTNGNDAPLIEYRHSIHGLCRPEPTREKLYNCSREYASNWNYVLEHRIPRMYYASSQRVMPDKV